MNTLLMALALGVAVGWAGSVLARTHTVTGLDLGILAGVAGAMLGVFVFGPMMGAEVPDRELDLKSLLAAFLGALLGEMAWLRLRARDPH